MSQFNPIQSEAVLSRLQKYLLRVVLGRAGKTLVHGERLVEVLETHHSLRRLLPLVESDLSESNAIPFWVPRLASDRKRFNTERRDKSRSHLTIGVCSGEPRPHPARCITLKCNFPSQSFLDRLQKLGYPPAAIRAAQVKAHMFWAHKNLTSPDRKANGKAFDDPQHPYVPSSPSCRTMVGGTYPKEKVVRALEQRGWNDNTQAGIFEVVYYKQSVKEVAAQRGLKVATVYQYASRLRGDLKAA